MKSQKSQFIKEIQQLVVSLIAKSPAGQSLCLIGGFRYRLLDGSSRRSVDVDYHCDEDLAEKREEIASLFERQLIPEVRKRFQYDGSVSPPRISEADSPSVKVVELAFYRPGVPHSRVEIPVEITHIVCLDRPIVKTVAGTVYLTPSDADMIESKILAIFNRVKIEERDLVDLFLFQNKLISQSGERIREKFAKLSLDGSKVATRFRKIVSDRKYHIKNIEKIIDEQLDPPAAESVKSAGGGEMVFDSVMDILQDQLGLSKA